MPYAIRQSDFRTNSIGVRINWELRKIKKLRKEIQIIFQDPYSSLNPNSDR
jgi:ABC-type microcin C transport system duplicated ATPase subunit YejF